MTQATTRHDPDSGSRECADSHSQLRNARGRFVTEPHASRRATRPEAVPPLDGQGRVRTLSSRDGHPSISLTARRTFFRFFRLRDLFVPFRDRPRHLLAQNHKRPVDGLDPPTSQSE